MRKSRSTESQIVAILKEGDAWVPVAERLRKHGISQATYFNWKTKYVELRWPTRSASRTGDGERYA